ncbi:MAG: M23 family metallopeptidase [Cytophagales bacterium]|nr:MAG: M23 family metallopeptidase [Cytophagales bacterium]
MKTLILLFRRKLPWLCSIFLFYLFLPCTFAQENWKPRIIATQSNQTGEVSFYIQNLNATDCQCEITLLNSEILTEPLITKDYYFIIPPATERQLVLTFFIKEPQKYNLTYSHKCLVGNPEKVQPDNFVYMFPFPEGKKHLLTQGYFGRYSHQNEHALDFKMRKGSEVVAARGGLIIGVKEDSEKGGGSIEYSDDANFIEILHADGTIATYLHLNTKGSLVEIGDTVAQGQLIGYSGNTGWSTAPHLHFVVNKPIKMSFESVATTFYGKNQVHSKLRTWRWYQSILR